MTIISVTVEEAEDHLRELLSQAERGKEIVITREGKPWMQLVPLSRKATVSGQRRFGQHRGAVTMGEDFDASLPENFWLGKKS